MIDDDKKTFSQAFNRLAGAGVIRGEVDRSTIAIYFDALSDLPLWAVEQAELHLRRHPVKFFEGTPTWHAAAERILTECRRQETLVQAGRSMKPEQCPHCRDTGLRRIDPDDSEGRLRHCECRDTNANYLRTRAQARLADEAQDALVKTGTPVLVERDFKRLGSGD